MICFAQLYKSRNKSIFKKRFIAGHYWHWRRLVCLVVLMTFSSSLFAPVFASYQPTINEADTITKAHKEKQNRENEEGKHESISGPIKLKVNNNETGTYFSPQIDSLENKIFSSQNKYQPYLEIGGIKHFNQVSSAAGIYDLFIPLLQTDDQILFTDLRIFDRSGSSSEGNLHLGFRKLYPNTRQMFGIYGAFDCRRSSERNNFNQLTLGLEYWVDKWFVGGNIYKPIGKTTAYVERTSLPDKQEIRNIIVTRTTTNKYYEKALSGVDAEIGYAITDNLTSYAGGYYFNAKETNSVIGPKIRLTYDYRKTTGRILGVLDGISIEAGAQHDKQRGSSAYVGIKFKVGLTSFEKNSNISGFERHMVELVRRDPDIVTGNTPGQQNTQIEIQQKEQGTDSEEGGYEQGQNREEKKGENIDRENGTLKKLLKDFGLPEDATWQDVRTIWKEYVFKYHPDKNKDGAEQFTYYSNIYEKLYEKKDVIKARDGKGQYKQGQAAASQPKEEGYRQQPGGQATFDGDNDKSEQKAIGCCIGDDYQQKAEGRFDDNKISQDIKASGSETKISSEPKTGVTNESSDGKSTALVIRTEDLPIEKHEGVNVKKETSENLPVLLKEFGLPENVTWYDAKAKQQEYELKYYSGKTDKNKDGEQALIRYNGLYEGTKDVFSEASSSGNRYKQNQVDVLRYLKYTSGTLATFLIPRSKAKTDNDNGSTAPIVETQEISIDTSIIDTYQTNNTAVTKYTPSLFINRNFLGSDDGLLQRHQAETTNDIYGKDNAMVCYGMAAGGWDQLRENTSLLGTGVFKRVEITTTRVVEAGAVQKVFSIAAKNKQNSLATNPKVFFDLDTCLICKESRDGSWRLTSRNGDDEGNGSTRSYDQLKIAIGATNTTISEDLGLKSYLVNNGGVGLRGPPDNADARPLIVNDVAFSILDTNSVCNGSWIYVHEKSTLRSAPVGYAKNNTPILETGILFSVFSNISQFNYTQSFVPSKTEHIKPIIQPNRNNILSIVTDLGMATLKGLKWLGCVIDHFFGGFQIIPGAYALEITSQIEPDPTNPSVTSNTLLPEQSAENKKEPYGIEELMNILAPEPKLKSEQQQIVNKIYTIDGLISLLNTIDSTSRGLTEDQINVLERVIKDGSAYNIQVHKLIARILTNYVTHYATGSSHVVFLVDLAKNENIESEIAETIINKFANDVTSAKAWRDNKVFDSFASLLSKDTSSYALARALIYANSELHGYMADIEALQYFEKLLDVDDDATRKLASILVAGSLEQLLLSYNSNTNLSAIERYINNLQDKTGKLPSTLIEKVFEIYNKDQRYFTRLIVDQLAEDKQLSSSLLNKLIETDSQVVPLENIKDPKAALFIALRLIQNHIVPAETTLKYFIQFLLNEDESIVDTNATYILAINLFHQLNKKIPEAIMPALADTLITLFPQVGDLQRSKIDEILKEKLNEKQKSRLETQRLIVAWYTENNLEKKSELSKRLFNEVNNDTAKELIPFFKKHLASQNRKLLEIAKDALIKLNEHQELFLSGMEKEAISFVDAANSLLGSMFGSYYKLEIGNDAFLLNKEQWQQIQAQFKNFSWNIKSDIKRIGFTDLNDLNEFLVFVQENGINERELNEGLGGHVLTVAVVYSELLKNFIANVGCGAELSIKDKEVLNVSASYLINRLQWPADFLFGLIKKTSQSDNKNDLSILITVLDKLVKYKISPAEMVDRNGSTAVVILKEYIILKKKPIAELLPAIDRLISDNHFFVGKEVDSFIEELKELNKDNPKILEMIDDLFGHHYFKEQLIRIKEIKLDWLKSKYAIVVSKTKPDICEEKNICLYKEEQKICLSTTVKTICLEDIKQEELKKLEAVFNSDIGADATIIYEQAARLGVAPKLGGIALPLSSWSKKEYMQWRQTVAHVDYDNNELMAEIIAVLSQAVHETILFKKGKKFYPRDIQLLALISLLKSSTGGLAQIATGEGKTLIIAMFAAIKVIDGRQVDIITSTHELAERDAADNKSFYELFNISVAHNVETRERGKAKECYEKDVVYGDILHFNGDALGDITDNVRLGRGFDILVVDEVDNMFIDLNSMKIQLSREIPGFDVLNQLLVYMWGEAKRTSAMLSQHSDPNKCYFKKLLDEAQKEELLKKDAELQLTKDGEHWVWLSEVNQNCFSIIEDHLTEYTTKYLFAFDEHIKTKRLFVVPSHLEEFVKDHLQDWIRSISLSLSNNYVERVHYILDKKPGDDLLSVVPTDIGNGVLLFDLQWSDGLHQFLQIKHALTMSTESVISIFMSYFGYFNKYKGKIYGVTGTLGTPWHHNFLRDVYGVTLSIIPTFTHKDSTEFPPVIANNEGEWQRDIIDAIRRIALNQKRPVLVVMETIEQVQSIEKCLILSGYNRSQVFTYGIGNDNKYKFNVKKELKAGDVVLATNLAGRGTDLSIDSESIKRGGLHVFVTTLSVSVRIEDQIYGRTARQGDPGSVQLIVNGEQLKADYKDYKDIDDCLKELKAGSEDISCLKNMRAGKEIQERGKDIQIKLPHLKITDNLFSSYVELMKELDTPTGYQLLVGKPKSDQVLKDFTLYLYKEETKIRLRIFNGKEIEDVIKKDSSVTELIKGVDPRAAKHIDAILSLNSDADNAISALASSLNKQDNELIHFIAANEGYRKISGIYERIKSIYDEVAEITKGAQAEKQYLEALLKKDPAFKDLQRSDNKIDGGLLEKIKLRKLFLLWLVDRKLYNHEYEIRQLNEYWGFWLRKHVDPLLRHAYEQIDVKEWRLDEIEKKIKSDFSEFRAKMVQDFNGKGFIKNKDYYVLKAWRNLQIYYTQPLDNNGIPSNLMNLIEGGGRKTGPLTAAESFLNEATNLDETYSWTAYNARAYINLIKDGAGIHKEEQAGEAGRVNKQFYNDTLLAIKNIQDVIIPGFEKQLTVLSAQEIIEIDSELTIQLIASIEFYKKIAEVLQKNIDNVCKAVQENGIVRTEGVVDTDKWAQSINVTATVLQNIGKNSDISSAGYNALGHINEALKSDTDQQTNLDRIAKNIEGKQQAVLEQIASQVLGKGGILIETSVYKLEPKEKDWLGTIFSAVMGVVFICVGVLLAPVGGVFVSVLANSLVLKGIGDIISSAISLGTGNPIDIRSYLKSTAISIGIAIVTAGVLSFADKMMGGIRALDAFAGRGYDAAGNLITGVPTKLASNPLEFISKAALMQAGTTVASIPLYDLVGRKMVKPEDIKEKASGAIEEIISDCKDALRKIFAGDLAEELYEKINNIVDKYLDRFTSVGAQFATGVPVNVASNLLTGAPASYGLGGLFQTAVDLTQGLIKNAEAIPEIVRDTKAAIRELAAKVPTSWSMMEQKLKTIFKIGDDANQLAAALISQGVYISNGEITRECNKLREVNLDGAKLNDGSPEGYKNGLADVCNDVWNTLQKDYDYTSLRGNFIGLTTGAITFIRKDLAHSGSQGLSTLIVNLINNGIEKKEIEKEKRQAKEERLAKDLDERLTKAKEDSYKKYTDADSSYEKAAKLELERALRDRTSPETDTAEQTKWHQVKKGESLSGIAARELGSKASAKAVDKLVNELIRLNPELATNPDYIQQGQVLRVPVISGSNYGVSSHVGDGSHIGKAKDVSLLDSFIDNNFDALISSYSFKSPYESIFDSFWNGDDGYGDSRALSHEPNYFSNIFMDFDNGAVCAGFEGDALDSFIKSSPEELKEFFNYNKDKVKSFFEDIKNGGSAVADDLKEKASQIIDAINAHTGLDINYETYGMARDVIIKSLGFLPGSSPLLINFAEGMANAGISDLTGFAEIISHPIQTYEGLKKLITSPEARQQFGDSVRQEWSAKIDRMDQALQQGNVEQLSREAGELFWQVGNLLIGVSGVAKASIALGKVGISVGTKGLGVLSDLAGFDNLFAKGGQFVANGKSWIGNSQTSAIRINNPDNIGVKTFSKFLPEQIPAGRLVYAKGFDDLSDLKNFEPGSRYYHGKVKRDLYLVNIHDANKKLVFHSNPGPNERTMAWATHLKTYARTPEPAIENLKQHLAMLYPDWGERNAVTIIKIPAGTETTFISGKAFEQTSLETGKKFIGGGFQVRFRDFDPKWIDRTELLNSKPIK
ncbi:Protein translocase subunit SecA (modular protein) [Gammaproteobacteria bacterium]